MFYPGSFLEYNKASMGNKPDIPPELDISLHAYVCLVRAAESVTARLQPLLNQHNLTVSQFGALEALFHLGPLCQRDLARKILKSSGNLTMVLENLERRNLIERSRNPKDRRFLTVSLTQEGRDLIASIFPQHARNIASQMSALSPEQQQALSELCRTLGKSQNSP